MVNEVAYTCSSKVVIMHKEIKEITELSIHGNSMDALKIIVDECTKNIIEILGLEKSNCEIDITYFTLPNTQKLREIIMSTEHDAESMYSAKAEIEHTEITEIIVYGDELEKVKTVMAEAIDDTIKKLELNRDDCKVNITFSPILDTWEFVDTDTDANSVL